MGAKMKTYTVCKNGVCRKITVPMKKTTRKPARKTTTRKTAKKSH